MKKNYDFRKVSNGFTIEERDREKTWDVTGNYVVETDESDMSKLAGFFASLIFKEMKRLRFGRGSISVEIEEPEAPMLEPQEERSNLPF